MSGRLPYPVRYIDMICSLSRIFREMLSVLVPHKMTISYDFGHYKIKTVFGEMVCRGDRISVTHHVREPVTDHCCTWSIACHTCGTLLILSLDCV